MSDYARLVTVDVDTGAITVDGEELPWFYRDVTPTVIEGENGEPVPGLTLTLACADLTVISPSKVLPDG
ncbi:hypothetical protein [Nocardia sp. NPDC052566]|uniref:hypothetical protein n=1 Tax=Nocardia sp. NPDC052566 TaxID=3364330 RepID=UPI0037CC749D